MCRGGGSTIDFHGQYKNQHSSDNSDNVQELSLLVYLGCSSGLTTMVTETSGFPPVDTVNQWDAGTRREAAAIGPLGALCYRSQVACPVVLLHTIQFI